MNPSRDIIEDRFLAATYPDALRRRWDVSLLDRLLRESPVRQRVRDLYWVAYDDTRSEGFDFHPEVVWMCLKREFKRDEVVALYLLLVVRYRDALEFGDGSP